MIRVGPTSPRGPSEVEGEAEDSGRVTPCGREPTGHRWLRRWGRAVSPARRPSLGWKSRAHGMGSSRVHRRHSTLPHLELSLVRLCLTPDLQNYKIMFCFKKKRKRKKQEQKSHAPRNSPLPLWGESVLRKQLGCIWGVCSGAATTALGAKEAGKQGTIWAWWEQHCRPENGISTPAFLITQGAAW